MNKLVAKNANECCGCGACVEVCPFNAISMTKDEYGVLYASLDSSKCVECGKCKSVCPLIYSNESNSPLEVYAAVSNSTDLYLSSSGGIFAALAKYAIQCGWSVYGASYCKQDGKLVVNHVRASSLEDIISLLGSKYVQSNIIDVFKCIENDINNNKKVLFCGTPCQCQAIKRFFRDYSDFIFTIDIVCHGVPSTSIFSDFINELEKKYNCSIDRFNFRDKIKNWGLCSIDYKKDGRNMKKYFYPSEISYYYLFENCLIMRPSCYQCKFAKKERVGDISIGDYWGIRKMQPELLLKNGGSFEQRKGVSLLLINSHKGIDIINDIGDRILKEKSKFDYVKCNNPQLITSSKSSANEKINYLSIYSKHGYNKVEKIWIKSHRLYLIKRFIINRLPFKIKQFIKSKI